LFYDEIFLKAKDEPPGATSVTMNIITFSLSKSRCSKCKVFSLGDYLGGKGPVELPWASTEQKY
jgi:hypothetical protein